MRRNSSDRTAERWAEIPDFPGYLVSDQGNMKSIDRHDTIGRFLPGQDLRPTFNNHGYLRVNIRRGGVRFTRSVHRLVLEAFVGPRPPGFEARHLDGNPVNNALSNLAWGSSKQNSEDKRRHGTERNGNVGKFQCPRGHDLKRPNLMDSQLKIGKRSCLACNRAHGYLRFNPELRGDLQKVSDSYYQQIMSDR